MSSIESFWSKVNKDDSGCWEWQAAVDSRGYGNVRWNGKGSRAHRVAFEIVNGPIPKSNGYHGTVVRHACDNKLCCNPNHLVLGTQQDNANDTKARDRRKGKCTGQDNGRCKLSIEQVRAIRADTRGKRVIAKDYLVSPAQIQRIRKGLQWVDM